VPDQLFKGRIDRREKKRCRYETRRPAKEDWLTRHDRFLLSRKRNHRTSTGRAFAIDWSDRVDHMTHLNSASVQRDWCPLTQIIRDRFSLTTRVPNRRWWLKRNRFVAAATARLTNGPPPSLGLTQWWWWRWQDATSRPVRAVARCVNSRVKSPRETPAPDSRTQSRHTTTYGRARFTDQPTRSRQRPFNVDNAIAWRSSRLRARCDFCPLFSETFFFQNDAIIDSYSWHRWIKDNRNCNLPFCTIIMAMIRHDWRDFDCASLGQLRALLEDVTANGV